MLKDCTRGTPARIMVASWRVKSTRSLPRMRPPRWSEARVAMTFSARMPLRRSPRPSPLPGLHPRPRAPDPLAESIPPLIAKGGAAHPLAPVTRLTSRRLVTPPWPSKARLPGVGLKSLRLEPLRPGPGRCRPQASGSEPWGYRDYLIEPHPAAIALVAVLAALVPRFIEGGGVRKVRRFEAEL